MKKLNLILAMMLATLLLQSCGGNTKKQAIDTIPGHPIAVSEDDGRFAVEAGESNVTDVELSDFAQSKLTSSKVKEFAGEVVKDRGKANDELLAIAKPKNIMLTYSLSGDGQTAQDELSQKTGNDFDKLYVTTMIAEYEKAIKLFGDATGNVKDVALNAYAAKTLPILKKHLAAITAINDGLK